MVRHPSATWTKNKAKKVADEIESDLLFDGVETEIRFNINSNLLFLDLDFKNADYCEERM